MNEFERFYNAALRFLSYRPRSEKEVRDRLKLKTQKSKLKTTVQSSKVIDRVVEKLKKYNFLNDLEFAKKWVENRMRFKPRSWRLIKLELKQKGVSEEIIEGMIHNSQFMIQSDLEQAKRLAEKKMGRFRNTRLHLPSQSDGGQEFGMTREKLGRYLASKGFNWDIIKKSIDETLGKGV